MARIRTIKPKFFQSEDVAGLSYGARLTWIGLWCYGDDDGRSEDNPRLIKGAVWPLEDDVDVAQIMAWLDELTDRGRILRYEVADKRYLEVVNFSRHQVIKNRSKTGYPAPESIHRDSATPGLSQDGANPPLTLSAEGEGEGEMEMEMEGEGEGEPPEPPLFCISHPYGSGGQPCGACADLRRAHGKWTRDHLSRTRGAENLQFLAKLQAEADRPHEHHWLEDGTCTTCEERQVTSA